MFFMNILSHTAATLLHRHVVAPLNPHGSALGPALAPHHVSIPHLAIVAAAAAAAITFTAAAADGTATAAFATAAAVTAAATADDTRLARRILASSVVDQG